MSGTISVLCDYNKLCLVSAYRGEDVPAKTFGKAHAIALVASPLPGKYAWKEINVTPEMPMRFSQVRRREQ